MVDREGNVLWVSLATGWSITGIDEKNPYGMQMWRDKLKAGWLPYSKCPVAEGYIKPADDKDKACVGDFSAEKCCKHIERAIRLRRADHKKRSERFSKKSESQMDRLIKTLAESVGSDERPEGDNGGRFIK